MYMSRPDSGNGSGRSNTPLRTLNTAVFAAIAMPIVNTVAVASFLTGAVLILIGAVTILLAAAGRRG